MNFINTLNRGQSINGVEPETAIHTVNGVGSVFVDLWRSNTDNITNRLRSCNLRFFAFGLQKGYEPAGRTSPATDTFAKCLTIAT